MFYFCQVNEQKTTKRPCSKMTFYLAYNTTTFIIRASTYTHILIERIREVQHQLVVKNYKTIIAAICLLKEQQPNQTSSFTPFTYTGIPETGSRQTFYCIIKSLLHYKSECKTCVCVCVCLGACMSFHDVHFKWA